MKWAHVAAWIGTAAAVSAGIWVTGSVWCLWAMILPAITQWTGDTEESQDVYCGGRERCEETPGG